MGLDRADLLPRDFTFVCPTELQGFAQLHDGFANQETTLMAASTDSYYTHKAWFESHSLLADVRYPVLADPSHALSRAFGVLDKDGAALRGTFLSTPRGSSATRASRISTSAAAPPRRCASSGPADRRAVPGRLAARCGNA